jgi:hypothetical protein
LRRTMGIHSSNLPAKSHMQAGWGVVPSPGNTVSNISMGVVHTINPTPNGDSPVGRFGSCRSRECSADNTNGRSAKKVSGSYPTRQLRERRTTPQERNPRRPTIRWMKRGFWTGFCGGDGELGAGDISHGRDCDERPFDPWHKFLERYHFGCRRVGGAFGFMRSFWAEDERGRNDFPAPPMRGRVIAKQIPDERD